MANNGNISVNATSYDSLKFSWEVIGQSTAYNYTSISWKLELVASSNGKISSSASKKWSVTVNGTLYSGTNTIGIENNATKTLAMGTTDIYHNEDGSKTFSFSFSQEFGITFGGSHIGTVSGSGSGVLPTLARKSTLAVGGGVLGESQILTVTQKSSSFTHTITYKCGTESGTICTKSKETSISWTPPIALASQAPSANSVAVTLTITTYSGNTNIGSSSVSISCSIPYSNTAFNPVLMPTITDSSGVHGTYGIWVQGQSKLKVDIETYGVYGAWITSVRTVFDGATYTGTSVTTNPIAHSGSMTVVITVTDSRGRTSESRASFTVQPYSLPKTGYLTAQRCNADGTLNPSGEYLLAKFSATISSLLNKNTAKYYIGYKKVTEESHAAVLLEDLENQYSVASSHIIPAETDSSYTVIFTAIDAFGQTRTVITGPSVAKVWSLLKKDGKIVGMAVGKVAEEEGVFDIGWKVKFSGGGDVVVEQGEKDGWTYRKWQSGTAECWKTLTHKTAITTGWGSFYHGTATSRQSYPFSFVDKPTEQVSLTAGSYQAIIFPEKNGNGVNGAVASACYNVARPSAIDSQVEFYISFYVVGKWKE